MREQRIDRCASEAELSELCAELADVCAELGIQLR
jgi:hypothetical protein